MKTLLLDRTAWDLVLDAHGNIALADAPYAIAQDCASAIRTFRAECLYDTRLGIPHFDRILGHWPPVPLLKSLIEDAALAVPGVVQAQLVISGLSGRVLTGQVQIVDETGVAMGITL